MGKSVEHRFDKGGEGGFAPAVLLAEHLQALLKLHVKIMKPAKIFDM